MQHLNGKIPFVFIKTWHKKAQNAEKGHLFNGFSYSAKQQKIDVTVNKKNNPLKKCNIMEI